MKTGNLLTLLILAAISSCAQMPEGGVNTSYKEFSFDPYKALGLKSNRPEELIEKVKHTKDEKFIAFVARDFYLKANDLSIRGDFNQAVFHFKLALDLTPDDLFIQKKLAYDLIRIGDFSGSKIYLENIYAKSSPKDETVGQLLASVYSTVDEKNKALKIYKELLVINPFSEESCLYLSRMYASEKKYKEAYALISKCNSGEYKYPSLSFFKGKMSYDQKKVVEAKKYFEEALEYDPTFTQAALAIGAILEEGGQHAQALKFYKSFVSREENVNDVQIITKIVNSLTNANKTEEVISYAERLIANESADLNMKVRLGLIYSDVKRYEEAIKLFNEIIIDVPESDKIRYYLGALYQQIQQYDEAIKHYNLIKSDSNLFADAGVQIGQMLSYMASDDSGQVIATNEKKFSEFIQERINLTPESAVDLSMIQANFFEEQHEFEKAIKSLDSVKNNKNFGEQHKYYYASMLERVGRYQESREIIKSILEKDKNNPHAMNFLGYSYLDRDENMDEAFKLISKAIELKPDDGYIRDSLAWYYYKVGNFDKALKEAVAAFKMVSNDPTITKHLALIYIELNQFDKAHKYLTQSLGMVKGANERENVLKLISDIQQKRLPASKND